MTALLLALTLAGPAQEPGDAVARHRALAAQATAAERAGDAATAVAACTAALELLPDGPRALHCADRLAWLEARRDADGGFAGWGALDRVRKGYGEVDDGTRREAVLALLAGEGLSEATRAEAALWLAADALDRLEDPELALASTREVHARRDDLEDALRTRAVLLHAGALARLGRLDEALEVEREVRVVAAAPRLTPVEVEARRQRREGLAALAWGVVAAFALVATPLAALGLRRPRAPVGLVPLLLLCGLTWLLVDLRDETAGAGLPAMTGGFVLLHVVAALARGAAEARWLRALLAALAASATVAVGWLALYATNTLGWVGL